MTGGLGASIDGFNIQSFHADLYTGAAGAEIAIAVPPGAAGTAPKIALSYSSAVVDDLINDKEKNQGDWVGLGWNLETGGFVLRDSKGTIGTSDDRFKLIFGGVSYDLVSIGSGNYRTKDETFLSINFNSSSDYWTVKTKDGATHRFGFTSNSRATGLTFGPNKEAQVTFRYHLDEVKTTSGVQVKYSYFKQSSSYNKKDYDQAVYIDTITYAYRTDSLIGPAREVRFIRGSRTDWDDVSQQWHASYHQLHRLDAIEVKVGTSVVRKYAFGYDYSIDREAGHTFEGGATGDLTLKTVTMLGSDGTTSLPAATFSYSGPMLASANNGMGGSVSFTYEHVTSTPLLYRGRLDGEDCGPYVTVTQTEGLCGPQTIAYSYAVNPAPTVPLYYGRLVDENGCGPYATNTTPGSLCSPTLIAYIYATEIQGTVPLYYGKSDDGESCGWYQTVTDSSILCGTTVLGYVYAAKINRYRVTARTVSDGRGWSAANTYAYTTIAQTPDGKEFRGHDKVRTIDPLGNYTDTWFFQDDIKKGRPYQIEVRNSADALFNKTTHTYTTSNPYQNVTFVALTRSDYFECEGQASCHQNAETFTYDSHGNRTQKNDLGDVGTTGDERTEVTDWIVDTTNWIHRPKRVALLNNSGATVRERWLYYDGGAWNTLGARGLLTKEESRLTGGVGHSGNPTVAYGHDIYGNRTSVTDARACTTTTVFEASQTYPSTVTNCLNHATTMVYDARFGVVTSQTDANGQTTTSEYDVFGRPSKVIGPLDTGSTHGTASTFYLNWGNPNTQKVTTYRTEQHGTANYIWSEEYFDGLGRGYKSQKEGPNGQTIVAETQFDARGQAWKTSAPRFTSETAVWTEFLYDVLGRQSRVNFPDGTHTETLYDHHEVTTIDPRGKTKRTHSDSHHRVSQVEEVNGGTSYFTNYEYDAADKLIKVTNAAGHNTLNVYDTLGRKVAMCDPNMGTSSSLTSCATSTPGAWVYTYSKAGDLLTQKDAKNQTLTFTYDSLGRPLTKKQGTSSLVTWTYDDAAVQFSKGRVTQIVDQATTTKFSYDQLGRTTQTQRTFLGVWHTMSQTYDALSRITTENFPDGEQVTYNYNAAGWLQSVIATVGPNYINDIQYNARGQKKTVTYGNSLVTTFTYNDPVDRPLAPTDFRVFNRTTSANQQNLTYGYDENGNVTGITDSLFTASRTFAYDDLNRMTTGAGTFGANQSNQNCSYAYNSIGNLTSKCGATLSYGDANHPSAVTNHAGLSKNYAYDANGNMLTRGNQTLTWDIDNRVISVAISGGGTTSMEYDYAGIRVKKTAPAGITLYPFQGYEIDPNGIITKLIKAGGEILAAKKGLNKLFYHNDHLGGVHVITDSNGQRCQLIEYDPWGAVSRSDVTNPACDPSHRFTGQKLDAETGLYYYGGRFFDSEMGRFVSVDPFIQSEYAPQNLNRYSYVINSPQNFTDPSGYFHRQKRSGGFFGSIFGRILGFFVMGPILGQASLATEKVPELSPVLSIAGGIATLASGNPWGLALIASGGLWFCDDPECQLGSGILGVVGGVGALAGGGQGVQTADSGFLMFACNECDISLTIRATDQLAKNAIAKQALAPAVGPVEFLGGVGAVVKLATGLGVGVAKVATQAVWPKTAVEMNQFLRMEGRLIADSLNTPGRNKTVWDLGKSKITFEQHPYHPNAPAWHRGPHWHLDTPGKVHQRFLPGEPIPGY